jgi:hypothetical protein
MWQAALAVDFQQTTRHYISEDSIFITTGERTSNSTVKIFSAHKYRVTTRKPLGEKAVLILGWTVFLFRQNVAGPNWN